MHVYTYIYIYIYIYIHTRSYIYIYRERERQTKKYALPMSSWTGSSIHSWELLQSVDMRGWRNTVGIVGYSLQGVQREGGAVDGRSII